MERLSGVIRAWVIERGFGFVSSADVAEDVFCHASALPNPNHIPAIGDRVSFELAETSKGPRAARVEFEP